MFPASFAPYIIKLIMPKIMDQFMEIFKLDKVLEYVEQPNDADHRIEKLEVQIQMLVEDHHPPAIDLEEWADVKETIKKIKNKKAFKSLGK